MNSIQKAGATGDALTFTPATLAAGRLCHFITDFSIAPVDLVIAFGPSVFQGNGYKTSAMWIFQSPEGIVFTIYDWKQTSLYEDDLPDPEVFWWQTWECDFTIGGLSDRGVDEFISFIVASVRAAKASGHDQLHD